MSVCACVQKSASHSSDTFFSCKCTLQMSATSPGSDKERKRGKRKIVSEEKREKKEIQSRSRGSVSPLYKKFQGGVGGEGGGVLMLQPLARAICLGLAVLFEILVSLLPNGTVIDISVSPSPIACPHPALHSLFFSFYFSSMNSSSV